MIDVPPEADGERDYLEIPSFADDVDWHRTHPLTPLISSWQAVVAVVFLLGQGGLQTVLTGEHLPTAETHWRELIAPGPALWVGLLGLMLIIVFGALLYAQWRVRRYRLTSAALEVRSGLIFRQQRRVRLDRVQAVDIVQPLLARFVGLAKLSVDAAGSGDAQVELAFVTHRQARVLRAELLAVAAGLTVHPDDPAPEQSEHVVHEVPPRQLVISLLLSTPLLIWTIGVVAAAIAAIVTASPGVMLLVIPATLPVLGTLWQQFSNGYGFTVASSHDGLRLRAGLLDRRAITVPAGRVQAISVRQDLFWRPLNWWALTVNVAGLNQSSSAEVNANLLLPVADVQTTLRVLSHLVTDLGIEGSDDPAEVVRAAMVGRGEGCGFTIGPPQAGWINPARSRTGFRATNTVLLLRRGLFTRRCEIVPHERTQSCAVHQGPISRMLGLASVHIHSTPGDVKPVVHWLSAGDARALFLAQSQRARRARLAADPVPSDLVE